MTIGWEVEFEWDDGKADMNAGKHGVTFQEAATAFLDRDAERIPDVEHSLDEDRFLLLATSFRHKILVVSHTARESGFESSAHEPRNHERGDAMKMSEMEDDEMKEEYDFSNSERAPYAAMAGEVHIVSLDGDVWGAFPDSEAVNSALRELIKAKTVMETGHSAAQSI